MSSNDSSAKNFKESNAEGEYVENISIDFVIFGLHGTDLNVLCLTGADAVGSILPGGYLHSDTRIRQSARLHLEEIVAEDQVYHEQLKVFDDGRPGSGKGALRIAYFALLAPEHSERVLDNPRLGLQWSSFGSAYSAAVNQREVLQSSLESLRHKVRHEPIVFNLLPEKFTLSNLQEAYEAILGVQFRKSNFRRKLAKMHFLVRCQERQKDVAHRAAELYRFDREIYHQACNQGFVFSI